MTSLPSLSKDVSDPHYCFLESRITAVKRLRIGCIGREVCGPSYVVDRAGFPCFGIEFVVTGVGSLEMNRHSYPLHAGVAFCYGPGVGHRIENTSGLPMIKYFVDFYGEEAEALLERSRMGPGSARQVIDVEALRFLFEQLIVEGESGSAGSAEVCLSYLKLIVLKLSGGIEPTQATGVSGSALFQQWLEFIDAHYLRLRDLNDIAGELGTRPAQLCRVFKQYGQPGPFQHLTRRKMNRAAELLSTGEVAVKEVAQAVGYPDPYHFSRLFKKHYGLSPVRFQERLWRTGGE